MLKEDAAGSARTSAEQGAEFSESADFGRLLFMKFFIARPFMHCSSLPVLRDISPL